MIVSNLYRQNKYGISYLPTTDQTQILGIGLTQPNKLNGYTIMVLSKRSNWTGPSSAFKKRYTEGVCRVSMSRWVEYARWMQGGIHLLLGGFGILIQDVC